MAALPGAIDEFIATGAGAPEVPDVVSEEGVQAPAWYARAKYAAEKKQEEEKLLWNGTAPSATPGPFPIGPAGRRLEPMKGYADKALEEAKGGTKGGKKAAELKEEAKLSRELVQIEKLMQERSEKRQKRDEGGGGGGGDEM